jgi:hypothetical protein
LLFHVLATELESLISVLMLLKWGEGREYSRIQRNKGEVEIGKSGNIGNHVNKCSRGNHRDICNLDDNEH